MKTESTMPTMVQSVGTSAGSNGNEASFPLHQKTISLSPAPTESMATIALPDSLKRPSSGWITSSLRPCKESLLTVATTVPMTRASCTGDLYLREKSSGYKLAPRDIACQELRSASRRAADRNTPNQQPTAFRLLPSAPPLPADRKSTRLNSSHNRESRMPSSA